MATAHQFPKDAKELQLTKELQDELHAAQAARRAAESSKILNRRVKKAEFVKLPYAQTMAVAGKTKNAMMAVMVELAYQVFKTHKSEVPLTNFTLHAVGISRWAKYRALRQLEVAGLIKISERERRKTLRVTVLWLGKI